MLKLSNNDNDISHNDDDDCSDGNNSNCNLIAVRVVTVKDSL